MKGASIALGPAPASALRGDPLLLSAAFLEQYAVYYQEKQAVYHPKTSQTQAKDSLFDQQQHWDRWHSNYLYPYEKL